MAAPSGFHWIIDCGSIRRAQTVHGCIRARSEARQCAIKTSWLEKSRVHVTWKSLAKQAHVLHFFSAHLPADVYQLVSVTLAPQAIKKTGRRPWLDEVSKAALNNPGKVKWAHAANVLKRSKMGAISRGSYQALFDNPGKRRDDWEGLMDDILLVYIMGRELRAAFKVHKGEDGEHSETLLQEFKDFVLETTVDGGEISTSKFHRMMLRRNRVRELMTPGVPECSLASDFIHSQRHNVHLEDDIQGFLPLYDRLRAGARTLKDKMGAIRTTFLVWSGRSRSVATFFLESEAPRLTEMDDVFSFIHNHKGPCGDGKTSDTRYFVGVGPGQNATCAAAVLNTFEGDKLKALVGIAKASSVDEAFQHMLSLRDFGGEDSTRFIIKNMLAPLGCADMQMPSQLFAWSEQWQALVIAGPNANKFFFCWYGEEKDHTKRHVANENRVRNTLKRINAKLPKRLVCNWHTKQFKKELRRMSAVSLQENICMAWHVGEFLFSGRSGFLSRCPTRV
jgi:hypothetical protein